MPNSMAPKRRFWKSEQTVRNQNLRLGANLGSINSQDDDIKMCLSSSQDDDINMCLSNSQDDDSMQMSLSKSHEYKMMVACRCVCRNHKFMLPKRRFWKSEPIFPNAFSKHFSTFRSPNIVLTPLKSASKKHSERLVQPSKIFVWEG